MNNPQGLSRRFKLIAATGFIVAAVSFLWVATAPNPIQSPEIPAHQPDLANGKIIYDAGGCIGCHKAESPTKNKENPLPSGGFALKTPLGVFYPPNLTPDPETGIGRWSEAQFITAMQRGLSPSGHYQIPAFPYTSYAYIRHTDLLDLHAYLKSLPLLSNQVPPSAWAENSLWRRGLKIWQWFGLPTNPWANDPQKSASWNRGAYLVNGAGHCNECHTPRTIFMTLKMSKALSGAKHPEGLGQVPSLRGLITKKAYKDKADLVDALRFGEEYGYENLSSGGMGEVQSNLAKLPKADIDAIADYLVSLEE